MSPAELARWQRKIDDADALRFRDPGRSLHMSRQVLEDVAAADGAGHGPWGRLQADAWGTLGSAYRAVGDLRRAEHCLQVALAFLDEQSPSPECWARFAQRASYLRCSQRRFAEALDLNDDVLRLYREQGLEQDAVAALVDRALFFGRAGRTAVAVELLERCLAELDAEARPRAHLAAVHNMAYYRLRAAGPNQEADALAWLERAEALHRQCPASLAQLQLQAMSGVTAIRFGRLEEGRVLLQGAHDGFCELQARPEQMLSLFHLSELYVIEGDPTQDDLAQRNDEELLRLAGLIFPLLKEVELPRVARRAVLRFLSAARARRVTLDLIHQATEELQQMVGA